MRKPSCSMVVHRRLARHGMPRERIERLTNELAEHWEDLRDEGMEEGLSEEEAEARADLRLGHPEHLAAKLIAGFRRNSWLGRHPILGLCVVPLFLAPLLMSAVALPLYWLDQAMHFTSSGGLVAYPRVVTGGLWTLYYMALSVSVLWLCHRGWKAGLGVRWVLAMCSWSALTGLLRFFDADPIKHNVVMGFGFPYRLDIHTLAILLLHALAAAGFLLAARNSAKQTLQKNSRNGYGE